MSDQSHPHGLLFLEDWWRAQWCLEKEPGSQLTWRVDESEGYRTHLYGVFSFGLLNDGRCLVCHIRASIGGSKRGEGNRQMATFKSFSTADLYRRGAWEPAAPPWVLRARLKSF